MSELSSLPITDTNGVEVPHSWSAAVDRGSLTFFAEEACPDCGKCRRFYVDGLRCYACTTPRAPTWTDIAPDYETAVARGFRLYASPEPCQAALPLQGGKPHGTVRTTATQRCTECEREERLRAIDERLAQRAAQDAADKAAYLALVREERKLAREARAEERKLERSAEAITHTVGRAGKGRKRTTERALKLIDTFPATQERPPSPKPPRKPRRAKATPRRNTPASRKP